MGLRADGSQVPMCDTLLETMTLVRLYIVCARSSVSGI